MKFFVKSKFFNKKTTLIFPSSFCALIVIGLALFVNIEKTDAWTETGCNGHWDSSTQTCYSSDYYNYIQNIFINSPAGTLSPGQQYHFQFSANATACGNRTEDFIITSGGQTITHTNDPSCSGSTCQMTLTSFSNYSIGPFTAPTTPGTYTQSFEIKVKFHYYSDVLVDLTGYQSYTVAWPPVTASCSISTSTVQTGKSVTWTAGASGGDGNYAYQWNGDVSGQGNSVTNSYSTTGEKHATVSVLSNGQTVTSDFCSAGYPSCAWWGWNGMTPVPGDYDGDGKTDIAGFDSTNGNWYFNFSSGVDSNWFTITAPASCGSNCRRFGWNGTTPVPGDYDGDGKTDIAVWDPVSDNWYIMSSITGLYLPGTPQQWGMTGDIPVPGDYDGDGKTDIAVFRPSNNTWYIRKSSSGSLFSQGWGLAGDIPVPGDYDGDGKTDIAVFRPSNGIWYIINSSIGVKTVQFGWNGTTPVPGDYDGDGKTDVAVWDPVYDNWYIASSLAGGAYLSGTPKKWGSSGAMPVGSGYSIKSKDYDGDGKADLTIFYPSTAHWYNYPSSGVAPYGFSALPSGNSLPSSSCSESSSVGTIDYLLVTPTPVHPITSASCRISTSTAYVGDPITWTATSSGGDGSFTYQWSGAVSGNQVSTTTVYSIPGLKQAYVTISSNGTSTQTGYCTNPSGSTTVNIISLPAINTSCAAYNNNGTQVFNVSTSTQVTWKATSTGGYGTFTYQWTNGSTGSSTSSTYNTVGNYYLGATSTSASSTYTVSATANCSPFPLVVSSSFSLNGLLINIPTGNLYVNQSFPVLADISKLKDSNGNSITLDPNTITYSWNGGIAAASSSTSLLYNTVSLKTITLSISGQTSSSTPYYAATSSVVNILLPTSTSTEQ